MPQSMASDTQWLAYLVGHIGEREIPGPEDNPIIVKWGKDAGIDWWNNDDDAWCAVAVNGALVNTGYPSTHSALARSFTSYGTRLARPMPGSIAVFPRGNNPLYGHVGIVESVNEAAGTVTVVNGNVSDEVRRSTFRIDSILPDGIRWPPGAPLPTNADDLPEPVEHTRNLSVGSRGPDVRALQGNLVSLGHKLTVDGIYGGVTRDAVMIFQSQNALTADGIYGPATASAMERALYQSQKRRTAETVAADVAGPAAIGGGTIAAGAATVTATSGAANSVKSVAEGDNVLGIVLSVVLVIGIVAGGGFFGWRWLKRRAGDKAMAE